MRNRWFPASSLLLAGLAVATGLSGCFGNGAAPSEGTVDTNVPMERLSLTVQYRSPGFEKYLTSLQEDAKKVGIELNLRLNDGTSHFKNALDHKFEILGMPWGTTAFPNPESMWHSSMIDAEGSVNIVKFGDPEADAIIEEYNTTFDIAKRKELLRKLDAIIFRQHPYALEWYAPWERIVYWNRFGTPKGVLPRYGEWDDVFATWWVDPEKDKALAAARRTGGSLPKPPMDVTIWVEEESDGGSGDSPASVDEPPLAPGDPGWTTGDGGPQGSPDAVKGGSISMPIPQWPGSLRAYGKENNTQTNYMILELVYQTLVGLDPNTFEFGPSLASHWWIAPDKRTFRFLLDERAKWSDGKPVVAADVLAAYKLVMDPKTLAPAQRARLVDLAPPTMIGNRVVEVKVKEGKEPRWDHFLAVAALLPLPAHEVSGMKGEDYLEKYNFAYTATSGPYHVLPPDIDTGRSITLTRRRDFWGENVDHFRGLYNFDTISLRVVDDRKLSLDKTLDGEFDFYPVYTSSWWHEEVLTNDAVAKGWVVAQKVSTKYPKGFQGLAFNLDHPILGDVRVRKAIALAYDRVRLVDEFAFGDYPPIDSYYPGSDYANPDNEKIRFDLAAAAKLLKEAGWSRRGPDGILVRPRKSNAPPAEPAEEATEDSVSE